VAQLFSLGSIEFMHPILAMGDIATPVLFLLLLIGDGILLAAVGLLALSLRKRSLVAVVLASIFVLIAVFNGVMFMPMARDAFIYPLSDGDFKSPDLVFWCRVAAVVWMLALTAAVFYFVRVIKKWKGSRHAA
jgi:hypothetical protein